MCYKCCIGQFHFLAKIDEDKSQRTYFFLMSNRKIKQLKWNKGNDLSVYKT